MNITLYGFILTIFGVTAVNDDAAVNKKKEFFEPILKPKYITK